MTVARPVPALLVLTSLGAAGEPLQVRVDNFTVPPATGPVVEITVGNPGDQPFTGAMTVRWPTGWRCDPPRQELHLPPRSRSKVAFTVEQGVENPANVYDVTVEVTGGGAPLIVPQRVVVATAPVLKPVIDGLLDEWQGMVPPITFSGGGRQAVVMTSYHRNAFCVAVRIEEDALAGLAPAAAGRRADAIQFAIAPPPRAGADAALVAHWEFVVAATAGPGPAQAFLLRKPGEAVAQAGTVRTLDAPCAEVQAAVARTGTATCYEVAIPLTLLPGLRPTTGRPFRFALLVHDGDGTGLRDMGTVMNQPAPAPGAWGRWRGDSLADAAPFGTDLESGFCTSLH